MYKFVFNNSNLGELVLTHIPKNVDEIKPVFVRSEKYHGINQQIEDVSFIWVLEAADYITNIINGWGAQSIITVVIYSTENNIDFDRLYSGELDLKSYLFDPKTKEVQCRLISSSPESKFLNNISTDYKVYLPSDLTLRRRDKEYNATWDCLTTEVLTNKRFINYEEVGFPQRQATIIDAIVRDGADLEHYNSNVVRSELLLDADGYFTYSQISINSIYECLNENSTVVITVPSIRLNIYRYEVITGTPTAQARINIRAIVFDINGRSNQEFILRRTDAFSPGGSSGATSPYASLLTFNVVTTSVNLTKGQKIAIVIDCAPVSSASKIEIDYKFDAEFEASFAATEYKTDTHHRSISVPRAFDRLIDATQTGAASTTDPTTSYLNTDLFASGSRYGRTYLTSGNELRRFTGSNGLAYTSFEKLWDALNVGFCLGMGVKKQGNSLKVQVDHRSKFYETRIVADLGEVTDFKVEFDPARVYNTLEIDYPSVDKKDYPNGIYEYLTKYSYTLPSTYVKNALQNQTDYKVDATSIEELRTNQITETQDNQTDDYTNFLIRCIVDGSIVTNSRGEEFDSISQTGLQNDTQLFNVDFFAPVTLRFWAWWILSALKHYSNSEQLINQRAEQNGDVAITIDGITCDTGDITLSKLRQLAALQDISDADSDLFEPFVYTFTAPVTADFIKIYSNDRHGVLKFSYDGSDFYGFPLSVPALPNAAGEFRLLKLSKRGRSLCV